MKQESRKRETRHVSTRVSDELFLQVKMRIAKLDTTLQEYLISLLYKDLKSENEKV
jgi:hypothetical protein